MKQQYRRRNWQIHQMAAELVPLETIARVVGCTKETVKRALDGPCPNLEMELRADRCPGCGGRVLIFPCLYCRMLNDTEIKREIYAANGSLVLYVKPRQGSQGGQ
jgi:DNA-directed RNA polymerase subunit RPC12/RpoP